MVNKKSAPLVGGVLITQYLQSDFWDGDMHDIVETATVQELVQKTVELINGGGDTKSRSVSNSLAVNYAVGIIHDKDTKTTGSPKGKHFHVWVKFNKKHRVDSIARWVGVEPQYIEKAKRGPYGEENILSYLIHANDASKYQYDPSEVESYNFDYIEYYKEHQDKWNMSKAKKRHKSIEVKLDYVLDEIMNGKITIDDIISDDELSVLYADNKNKMDSYFSVSAQRKAQKTLAMIDSGEIKIQSYFITGAPGKGKTRYAKQLIERVKNAAYKATGSVWRVHDAGATNPMDGYNGQEIILMDDLRVGAMSASDWLKMLDPFTTATMSARYNNKQQASRVLIITSYIDPHQFFYFAKGNGGQNEALDQFIRRLQGVIRVYHYGEDNNDGRRWVIDTRVDIDTIGALDSPYKVRIPSKNPDFSDSIIESEYGAKTSQKGLSIDDALEIQTDEIIEATVPESERI